MIRFLADENFNNQVVRGILRQSPNLDIVRVQDVSLSGVDDPSILAWAAQEERVVLTHDAATMTNLESAQWARGLGLRHYQPQVPAPPLKGPTMSGVIQPP